MYIVVGLGNVFDEAMNTIELAGLFESREEAEKTAKLIGEKHLAELENDPNDPDEYLGSINPGFGFEYTIHSETGTWQASYMVLQTPPVTANQVERPVSKTTDDLVQGY